MIKRYRTKQMSRIWSERNKFKMWLKVELAVIWARVMNEEVPEEIYQEIKRHARFTVRRIEEIDNEIHHDLLAFVGAVQEKMPPKLQKYFHYGMTSFDTEEPATALLFLDSGKAIVESLELVKDSLLKKANECGEVVSIGRTHGQHAQAIYFAFKFLRAYDQFENAQRHFEHSIADMKQTSINGAVGTYGPELSPVLELHALEFLGLEPARISSQIIQRDRHFQVIAQLARIAGVIEDLATNLRLLGMTEIREAQEPFGKKQKGSSAMPHKKNTILTENLCGLVRIVRAYLLAAHENIVSWEERDISHSSAERILFQGSFHATHFMLLRLEKVIRSLVINRDQIEKNLHLSCGTIFAGDVMRTLQNHGMLYEEAFRLSQGLAFKAVDEGKAYKELLLHSSEVPSSAKKGDIQNCFNFNRQLVHASVIFDRFPSFARE